MDCHYNLAETAGTHKTHLVALFLYVMDKIYAHYMHTTCTLHAHYMHTTCTLHAHYIRATCALHAHYMRTTCTLHAHFQTLVWTRTPRWMRVRSVHSEQGSTRFEAQLGMDACSLCALGAGKYEV